MSNKTLFKNYISKIEVILDNMFNAIIAVDSNDKILFINEAASILFDIDSKGGLGKNIKEIMPDPDIEYFLSTKKEEIKRPIVVNELNLI